MPGPRPKRKFVNRRKEERRKETAKLILLKRKGEKFHTHNVVLSKEKTLNLKGPIPDDLSSGHNLGSWDKVFVENSNADNYFAFKNRRKGTDRRRKKTPKKS